MEERVPSLLRPMSVLVLMATLDYSVSSLTSHLFQEVEVLLCALVLGTLSVASMGN